jgi:drug/metabolite transporter (DMT)-like permease
MFIKRHGRGVSSVLLNRNAMLFGGLLLGTVAVTFERDAPARWNAHAWFTVLYLALVGTVLTFGLYFWLMRHVAAYRLSLIAFLTPLVALLIGALLGGEALPWRRLAGAALILGGVATVLLLARRSRYVPEELAEPAAAPRA